MKTAEEKMAKQLKVGAHVKNRITGQYLGKVARFWTLPVATVDGSTYVQDNLAVATAPRKRKPRR